MWINFERKGALKAKKLEQAGSNKKKGDINKKITKKKILKILSEVCFEKIEILWSIGALTPFFTSLVVPVISTYAVAQLNILRVKTKDFKFNVIPIYDDLKNDLSVNADVYMSIGKFLINVFA